MINQSKENIKKHIKTHTKHSDEDRAAVSILEKWYENAILKISWSLVAMQIHSVSL